MTKEIKGSAATAGDDTSADDLFGFWVTTSRKPSAEWKAAEAVAQDVLLTKGDGGGSKVVSENGTPEDCTRADYVHVNVWGIADGEPSINSRGVVQLHRRLDQNYRIADRLKAALVDGTLPGGDGGLTVQYLHERARIYYRLHQLALADDNCHHYADGFRTGYADMTLSVTVTNDGRWAVMVFPAASAHDVVADPRQLAELESFMEGYRYGKLCRVNGDDHVMAELVADERLAA